MTIRLLCLGAGQDVGRSCVLVTLAGCTVMFDCGMHMGFADERRFPDFSVLCTPDITAAVDAVIVSHFHLDHCGALPYLTEQVGYRGPVLMTHATRALAPILLEDYRKITVDRRGEAGFFTTAMMRACISRSTGLAVGETHRINVARPGAHPAVIEITPHYAGHVLGAAMFHVRVGGQSVLYTGDYNATADRHLGAARPPPFLAPDALITESTYATTLRDSKRRREAEFLRAVHECVLRGGKVLVPVFALGRVQELCVLVDAYWRRHADLARVPVYFSAGMAETAAAYYRAYADWAGDGLREAAPVRSLYDFACVRQFQKHHADAPGPMVLFSSPGMLHSGTSLEVFRRWAGDARNLLVIPGFCVSGTVGARLLAGQRVLTLSEDEAGGVPGGAVLEVRMQIRNMSFSAHADARGIMSMARWMRPRSVVLVHGEASKMAVLRNRVEAELGVPCFDPPNGEVVVLPSSQDVPVSVPVSLLDALSERTRSVLQSAGCENSTPGYNGGFKTLLSVSHGTDQCTAAGSNGGSRDACGDFATNSQGRDEGSVAPGSVCCSEIALGGCALEWKVAAEGGVRLELVQGASVDTYRAVLTHGACDEELERRLVGIADTVVERNDDCVSVSFNTSSAPSVLAALSHLA